MIEADPNRKKRHTKVGVEVTAGPVVDEGFPATLEIAPSFSGDLMNCSATNAWSRRDQELLIEQPLQARYRRSGRKSG